MTIWLTTVGRDGAPQPNPVGFLWEGGELNGIAEILDDYRAVPDNPA